jgi:hypothetical protein
MFLNLFGSDGPCGVHAGDYRDRFPIAMVRPNSLLFPHCRNNGLRLEIANACAVCVLVNSGQPILSFTHKSLYP